MQGRSSVGRSTLHGPKNHGKRITAAAPCRRGAVSGCPCASLSAAPGGPSAASLRRLAALVSVFSIGRGVYVWFCWWWPFLWRRGCTPGFPFRLGLGLPCPFPGFKSGSGLSVRAVPVPFCSLFLGPVCRRASGLACLGTSGPALRFGVRGQAGLACRVVGPLRAGGSAFSGGLIWRAFMRWPVRGCFPRPARSWWPG